MQINVSGQHVDLTDALREYVTSKLKRLERHFDHVTDTHVVLSVEKKRRRAEATVRVSGAKLFANATDGDMYAAIDALADKLDGQIRRHKEKLTDHHRADGGIKGLANPLNL
ncbi:MAG: ribosome-associated translation inhibitor RaiA [Chromatiales bacterium]|jgi:putative sigma-54 modulation protein|nr:ribosome-associated translation inhibitor RaiA [Chromatiales bacterium]